MQDQLYREIVIDHYRRPRNRGRLRRCDAQARVSSSSCGDELGVTLAFDGERVTEIRFDGDGCAISQALASIASERYVGMRARDILALGRDFTADLLGSDVSEGRRDCATLHLVAVQRALAGVSR